MKVNIKEIEYQFFYCESMFCYQICYTETLISVTVTFSRDMRYTSINIIL